MCDGIARASLEPRLSFVGGWEGEPGFEAKLGPIIHAQFSESGSVFKAFSCREL